MKKGPNRSGRLKSTCVVPHCQSRPMASRSTYSNFGPQKAPSPGLMSVLMRWVLCGRRLHRAVCVLPHLVGADAIFRPGRELDRQFALETEIVIGRQDQVV